MTDLYLHTLTDEVGARLGQTGCTPSFVATPRHTTEIMRRQPPMSPLDARLRTVHRGLSRTLRVCGESNPDALPIFVHALSAEDVIVQVLLRGTSPLMLKLAPARCAPAAWLADRAAVRRYSRAVRSATYTYVSLLDGAANRSGHGVTAAGTSPAERVLEHLLIPCLARAAADIAAGAERRAHEPVAPEVDESASPPPASVRSNHHR